MSVEGLLLALLLAGLTSAWVGRPLLRRQGDVAAVFLSKQQERARAYYERVLANIRDLDEDFNTGKISPEEYASEREQWVQRGMIVLKLIDELDAQHNIIDNTQADDAAIDAAIEAAIQAARAEPVS
ncbi:MAG: hypothetical protein MUE40_01605 [Anaerolineae bacterium]|nr:hypothetical protein [Anaerolineae bacterium]